MSSRSSSPRQQPASPSWAPTRRAPGGNGRALRRVLGISAALLVWPACFNSHVFDIIDACETEQVTISQPIEASKPADILIVVDNSGSMCEEQANLVANFYNPNPDECPIADLENITDERYLNPTPEIVATELNRCGFIQILAAYENDFRVGVITTDVGTCDNRFGIADDPNLAPIHPNNCKGEAIPDWGRRPQRGCLQAPPGVEQKFLTPETENIGQAFADTLENIQTFGSAFERGLDATRIFLDEDSDRHEDCATDRDDFIREEASLLVMILTDEDDCSHEDTPDFPDEISGESCEGKETLPEQRDPPVSSAFCYDAARRDALTPVSEYVSFLSNLKQRATDVRVAVIAGALFEDDDPQNPASAAGCRVVDGAPDGTCFESGGASNFVQEGSTCDPERLANEGLPPCCQADPGTRYYELADGLGGNRALRDSICFASFRDTLIEVAQFAARVESITLSDPPAVPEAIVVEIFRAEGQQLELINRIPDGEEVDGRSGWQLEGTQRIQFHGEAVPQPGDDIRVSVLADGNAAPAGEAEPCIGFSGSSSSDGAGSDE